MPRHLHRSWLAAVGASVFALLAIAPRLGATVDTLPAAISDREFWSLTEQLSEPNGQFQSDNLMSNEMTLSTVATALAAKVKPGGVYLGVGPEQNFTYIAAIRPRIVFITDIRRGNLHLHLMYKALFEMSANRADFVSRLFTKKRPDGLSATSTAGDLMNAYWNIPTSDAATYQANLQAIKDLLVKKHGFPLPAEDLAGIEYVYHAFYWYGPSINYSSTTSGTSGGSTTYADLMMTRDAVGGGERSYLSSEDNFTFLKTLHSKNLIVPLVGDFAGPKALRAVGGYLKTHGAIVTAFYLSNVESYLTRNGVWNNFCSNVATMPLDADSTFIRPSMRAGLGFVTFVTRSGTNTGTVTVQQRPPQLPFTATTSSGTGPLGSMADEVVNCR